jgi:hypothetical protein
LRKDGSGDQDWAARRCGESGESRDVQPAAEAVDHARRRERTAVAREHVRPLPNVPEGRSGIVRVHDDKGGRGPRFELFKNCLWAVVK